MEYSEGLGDRSAQHASIIRPACTVRCPESSQRGANRRPAAKIATTIPLQSMTRRNVVISGNDFQKEACGTTRDNGQTDPAKAHSLAIVNVRGVVGERDFFNVDETRTDQECGKRNPKHF
jgi:hypothetical protein